MELTCMQIIDAYNTIKDFSEQKLPFKLSLLISRNLAALQKEYDFYMEQEKKFVLEYLIVDQATGQIKQMQPGVFAIQDGKYEECIKAREALDNFIMNIEIRKIPISMLEPFEFTPAQLLAIEFMIEEEEEHE